MILPTKSPTVHLIAGVSQSKLFPLCFNVHIFQAPGLRRWGFILYWAREWSGFVLTYGGGGGGGAGARLPRPKPSADHASWLAGVGPRHLPLSQSLSLYPWRSLWKVPSIFYLFTTAFPHFFLSFLTLSLPSFFIAFRDNTKILMFAFSRK